MNIANPPTSVFFKLSCQIKMRINRVKMRYIWVFRTKRFGNFQLIFCPILKKIHKFEISTANTLASNFIRRTHHIHMDFIHKPIIHAFSLNVKSALQHFFALAIHSGRVKKLHQFLHQFQQKILLAH